MPGTSSLVGMSVIPVTTPPGPSAATPQRLRDRRRQELRQHLSDVATRLFLDRGFDAVRVSDVADACGVTVKTVFNHFPTKEALLADRWDTMAESVHTHLADPVAAPVDAVVRVLTEELAFLTAPPRAAHLGSYLDDLRRFSDLVRSTPALLAHEAASLQRITAVIAASLAERAGTQAEEPEAWISAAALTGLWTVFYRALHHNLATGDPDAIRHATVSDLNRAAAVLRHGL